MVFDSERQRPQTSSVFEQLGHPASLGSYRTHHVFHQLLEELFSGLGGRAGDNIPQETLFDQGLIGFSKLIG